MSGRIRLSACLSSYSRVYSPAWRLSRSWHSWCRRLSSYAKRRSSNPAPATHDVRLALLATASLLPPGAALTNPRIEPLHGKGTSLAVLDVLNSGCGVLAPMLGGIAMQYGGLQALPLLAMAGYSVLLAASWLALPASKAVDEGKKSL